MSTSTSFEPLHADTGKTVNLSMQRLWLTGQVLAAGARLVVQHVFQSEEDTALEVIYSFPLPRDAALRRFRITGDGFEVHSELKETEDGCKGLRRGNRTRRNCHAGADIRRRRRESHGRQYPAEGDGHRPSGDLVRNGIARRWLPLPFSVHPRARLPLPSESRGDGTGRRRDGTPSGRIWRYDPSAVSRRRLRASPGRLRTHNCEPVGAGRGRIAVSRSASEAGLGHRKCQPGSVLGAARAGDRRRQPLCDAW